MVTVAVWLSRETSKDLTPGSCGLVDEHGLDGVFCSLTIELLEDALDCARAAATGHGNIELVSVVGHCLE